MIVAFVEHNTSHAHKQLLHRGFHLVEHQHTPHALHGMGALVAVLVVVHLAAVGFLLYLFMHSAEASSGAAVRQRRLRERQALAAGGASIPPPRVRCVAENGPGSASRFWKQGRL